MELVVEIYKVTSKFPKEEIFGLVSQMRRAAISLPSNIAEGTCRKTKKDFTQFLRIAFGSGAELETQIEICKRIPRLKDYDYAVADNLLIEIMKMLNKLIGNGISRN